MICFCSPQLDTGLHFQTIDTGLLHHMVCLFTCQLSLLISAPTHGRDGQAELMWVAAHVEQSIATLLPARRDLRAGRDVTEHVLLD